MSKHDVPVAHRLLRFEARVPVLQIPPGKSFEELRQWLRESLPAHIGEIGGRSSRLDFGERSIQLFDLRRLIHFLGEEFSLDITGLYVRRDAIHRYAERELKLKLFPTEPEIPEELQAAPGAAEQSEATTEEEPTEADSDQAPGAQAAPLPVDEVVRGLNREVRDGRRSHTVHRTLRSGSTVRFDGDILIFGDVNPGAQVTASGNIVVLGSFRGMAHAGATGDDSAFVFAHDLRPTQLRIARHIAVLPEPEAPTPEEDGPGARLRAMARVLRPEPEATEPQVARVQHDAIVLSSYRSDAGDGRSRVAVNS